MNNCDCITTCEHCAKQRAAIQAQQDFSNQFKALPKKQKSVFERDAVDPRGAQAMALFLQLDERGKRTALAMLAVAVKLHAEVKPG